MIDPYQPAIADVGEIEGIGLYRSETLLNAHSYGFPSEDEQYEVYKKLCGRWKDFPVTIRTFDIGGDKTLPYFSLGPQENPYLGLRAHRIYHYYPELFLTQIKAILRAGLECSELRVLYPMVETMDELLMLEELVDQATKALEREKVPFRRKFKQGVLIEVPSTIWALEELFKHIDFASVGTNDLLQYHFAVDRGNANVNFIYRHEHPSALRMLKRISDMSFYAEKPVTICGEIASDPKIVQLLFGLGFSNLSIDAHDVKAVRRAVPNSTHNTFKDLANRCLSVTTAEEVRTTLDSFNINSIC